MKKILALALLPAMLLSFAACGGEGGGLPYKDMVERPEIDMPDVTPALSYPEKPASKPAEPAAGVKPAVVSYEASKAEYPYKVEEGETVHITYNEPSSWSYVYAAVENYSPAYGNIKITLRNSAEYPAEHIGIQAVYYEMYDLGYSPVTVYVGDLTAGEQYVVSLFGEHAVVDNVTYAPVGDEKVKDKTILGFIIYFDSMTSYPPTTDGRGDVEILSCDFLADNDPALEDRYLKPTAMLGEAAKDGGDTLIPIENYSEDYAKLVLTYTAGASFSVGLRYKMDGQTYTSALAAPEEFNGSYTFDYTALHPVSDDPGLASRFVKNGEVTHLVIRSDADVEITSVEFVRTAFTGAYVTDWTSSTKVIINHPANGGNCDMAYEYHTTWDNSVTATVKNGSNVSKITLELYVPDEDLNHIGFGIINNSTKSSEAQQAGNFILRAASQPLEKTDSERTFSYAADSPDALMSGIKETVSYNEAAKTYTITYDFSGVAADADGKKFADYTLVALRFYMNCQAEEGHDYEGAHHIYFLSITLE